MRLEEGTLLADKYRIGPCLGQGGMGLAYAARNEWTQADVVVKAMQPYMDADRFLREVRATARLKHPNIVEVLDLVKEAGGLFMILERLNGHTLDECLRQQQVLSISQTMGIMLPILEALALAHEQRLIHRDIKPSNIFLAQRNDVVVPKLLDFGIARLPDEAPLTLTGQVFGTPGYMPPEQLLGQEPTPATDIWAVGVVLYQCVTGMLPFGNPATRGRMSPLQETLPDTAELPSDGTAFGPTVVACLAKNPGIRIQNARELLVRLREQPSPTGLAFEKTLAATPSDGTAAPTPTGTSVVGLIGSMATEFALEFVDGGVAPRARSGKVTTGPNSGFVLRLKDGRASSTFEVPLARVEIGSTSSAWLVVGKANGIAAQMRPVGPSFAIRSEGTGAIRRNGILITREVLLHHGDVLSIGEESFVFERQN